MEKVQHHRDGPKDDMLYYCAKDCKAKMVSLTYANAAFSKAVRDLNHHSLMACRSMVDATMMMGLKKAAESKVSIRADNFAPDEVYYRVVPVNGDKKMDSLFVPEASQVPLSVYNGGEKNEDGMNVFAAIVDIVAKVPPMFMEQPKGDWHDTYRAVKDNIDIEIKPKYTEDYRKTPAYNKDFIDKMRGRHLLVPSEIKGAVEKVAVDADLVFWFPARELGATPKDVPRNMRPNQASVLVVGKVINKKTIDEMEKERVPKGGVLDEDLAFQMCEEMRDKSRLELSFHMCKPSEVTEMAKGAFQLVRKLELQRNCTAHPDLFTRYVRLDTRNTEKKEWTEASSIASRVRTKDHVSFGEVPIDEYVKDGYLHLVPLLQMKCGKKVSAINICSCNTRATNTNDKYWIQTTLKVNYMCEGQGRQEAITETVRLTYIVSSAFEAQIMIQLNYDRMAEDFQRERSKLAAYRDAHPALPAANGFAKAVKDGVAAAGAAAAASKPVPPPPRVPAVVPKTPAASNMQQTDAGAAAAPPLQDGGGILMMAAKEEDEEEEEALSSDSDSDSSGAPAKYEDTAAEERKEETLPSDSDSDGDDDTEKNGEQGSSDEPPKYDARSCATRVAPRSSLFLPLAAAPAAEPMSTLQSFMRPRRDIASIATTPASVGFLPADITPEGSQRMVTKALAAMRA